ncbi:MAG: type I restriction-modification enzyme R subunit C-terminal domain-containing protein [Thermodesulfobacteriota bacterium]
MADELEWQTRRDRINKRLKALNPSWEIVKYAEDLDVQTLPRHAVEEYPTAKGPADYALFVNGQLLGILEAKKVKVGPQNVLEQAKRYARGAFAGAGNWNGYRVPFLYASNGEIIWHLDARDPKNISRQISNFHTPDALEELFADDITARYDRLKTCQTEIAGLRNYQKQAIEAVEEAMAQRKRAMLLAMATGTGKTFTTVSLTYRLLEARAARRILFLVDRRALAAQAVREFSSFTSPSGSKFDKEYEVYSQRFRREDLEGEMGFDPKVLPTEYLTSPRATHTFVYVSTIQRMTINLFGWEHAFPQDSSDPDYEEDTGRLDIPIHAFDVIIADECHRGYTAKETAIWRQVMDYFDAVKIGLTATPAAHTLALFKEVIYRYTTEQAIQDGHLVDYDAVKIRSGVRVNGIFLKPGEHVGVIDTDTGRETYDELEDEREFATQDIEQKITSPDSNSKTILEVAKYAYQHQEETGRFPKILIFAANDLPHTSHCDQLVGICKEVFGQGDDFVKKITGSPSVDRPLQRIREFRNRPNPKIVVTVDMLTTGVDIPPLEFIVFLRPVKSRILWVQMLGRGTRRCTDIFKEKFTIFDCFDGTLIEYFKDATDFKVELPQKEPIPLDQVIENIYQNVDRPYFVKVLVKRLRRIERTMSGEAMEAFSAFIPDGDMGRFVDRLPGMLQEDFAGAMKLLRNKQFQEMLINYPRAKRQFLIGYDVEDEVDSEFAFSIGSEYRKPEDYLELFARFVKNNPDHIDAIQILLERPKEWHTDVLEDLRTRLEQNHFSEKDLQKAHHLVYKKPLADIISMVKHGAKTESPLLSAQERVDAAMDRVTAGKTFSSEQQQWLGYIREHLIENLSIETDHFDYAPVFERHGGLSRARAAFQEDLDPLIEALNYAIAA